MDILEIYKATQKASKLNQKELACFLSIKDSEIRDWKKGSSVPSIFQVQNILHFATLMNVDTSAFRWETYIAKVLEVTYKDEYRIGDEVDEQRFRVHLYRTDGTDGYVPIEEITNRKKDLFKNKGK